MNPTHGRFDLDERDIATLRGAPTREGWINVGPIALHVALDEPARALRVEAHPRENEGAVLLGELDINLDVAIQLGGHDPDVP